MRCQRTKCVLGMALCLGFAANAFADEFVNECAENAAPPFDEEAAIHSGIINDIWSAYVRAVRVEAGKCPLYALKKAKNIPANHYERIEPMMLDQYYESELYDENGEFVVTLPQEQRLGFIAHRNGVSVLLNSRGKRIIPDEFSTIDLEGYASGKNTILVKIRNYKGYTYLRIQNGRLLQRAPHWYQGGGYRLNDDYWVAELRNGYIRPVALLNLKNLSEALPPSDISIDHFGLDGHEFIFTMKDTDTPLPPGITTQNKLDIKKIQRYQLYDRAAARLSLPEFHDFRIQYPIEVIRSILALYNYESMTCRLYATSPEGGLYPVIDQPLSLIYGNCPKFDQDRLIAQYADKTRVFILQETTKSAALEGELPGAFFAKTRDALVVKMQQNDKTLYRVFNHQGELINEKWFEDALNLGCGHVRLKHEGVWYTLWGRGSLSEEMRFPVHC